MALKIKKDTSRAPLVSAIIVTHNRKYSLARTINSLLESSYKNLEIIVVDDASTDGTYDYLVKKYHELIVKGILKVIVNNKELLPALCVTKALRQSKGLFILIIADDVVVERNCIEKLMEFLSYKKDAGIVSPIVYYYSKKHKTWWAGSKVNMLTSRTYVYGRDLRVPRQRYWKSDTFTTIALVRREIFINAHNILRYADCKLFPIHNEEADFSFKARMKGWNIYVLAEAKAYHDISVPKNGNRTRAYHVHTPMRAYYAARNRILLHRKYSKWWKFTLFLTFFNWIFTLYYLKLILSDIKIAYKDRSKIAISYLKGIIDGLRMLPQVMYNAEIIDASKKSKFLK